MCTELEKMHEWTALHLALLTQDIETFAFLFKKNNIDVNGTYSFVTHVEGHDIDNEITLLQGAVLEGKVGIVKFLLDQPNIKVDAQDKLKTFTPLSYAADENKVEVLKLLLKSGANIDQPNNQRALCDLFKRTEEVTLRVYLILSGFNASAHPLNSSIDQAYIEIFSLGIIQVLERILNGKVPREALPNLLRLDFVFKCITKSKVLPQNKEESDLAKMLGIGYQAAISLSVGLHEKSSEVYQFYHETRFTDAFITEMPQYRVLEGLRR